MAVAAVLTQAALLMSRLLHVNHKMIEDLDKSCVMLAKHGWRQMADVEGDKTIAWALGTQPLTPQTEGAPGPGAIRKVEWTPLAKKWLVILPTGSAKSYKTKVPGMLHDKVVHEEAGQSQGPIEVEGPDLCEAREA